MKKIKIFVLLLIVFCPVFVFGCTSNLNLELQTKLSEVDYNFFETSNNEVNVSFISGFREDPYILNGTSENKKEFGLITLKFFINISSFDNLPSFKLTINEQEFLGEFELNPFNNTFVADIEKFVLDDSVIVVDITFDLYFFSDSLENLSNSYNLNHKQALNIFINEFKAKITQLLNKNIDFEVYVRIINDRNFEIDKKYFYVNLISINGQSYSCIIDTTTQQVLSKTQLKNNFI